MHLPLPLLLLPLPALAQLTYVGVDWSSLALEEAAGRTYKASAGAAAQPLETILKANGVNTVRQRLWVNPAKGAGYDLEYNLKLAARAKKAGLGVYLDMHFSDTWADPGHQAIPSGWPTNIDDLSWRLYNYTLQVSSAFASAGLSPTLISIGNEITAGLLLPVGALKTPAHLARLLHSASAGIRASPLGAGPKIMIHLDNGWDGATQTSWYKTVLGAGGGLTTADFDVMGVSYYPFYSASATLAALTSSLRTMAATWAKELVVAETDWPVACPSPRYAFPADVAAIPKTAAGQATFVKEVARVVQGTQGGAGLFYWEPAWVDNANLGSSCADCLMVDGSGVARSSLGVFAGI